MLPSAPGQGRTVCSPRVSGSEDYFEVSTPADGRGAWSQVASESPAVDPPEAASRCPAPLAVVLPTDIPCENPGEMFILLRDEVIGGTVEVEFASNDKRIRTRPALWSKTVWCMKALDFPAGPVAVSIYCDGLITATAEIQYHAPAGAAGRTPGMAGPGDAVCQAAPAELDAALAGLLRREMPGYAFPPPAAARAQDEHLCFQELPTFLHCAAKFGLKNLAVHLLGRPGAAQALRVKNVAGSAPAQVAEQHGHTELKEILEGFSVQGVSRSDDQENYYEEAIASPPGPAAQPPAPPPGSGQTQRLDAGGEGGERAADEAASENQYEDLYVFMPGGGPKRHPPAPCPSSRPPPPPPRAWAAAFQLEKPHCSPQGETLEGPAGRLPSSGDAGGRRDVGEEEPAEEEEDPYIFTEVHDSDYDIILADDSAAGRAGSPSFLINRPPAPTPRPVNAPAPREEAGPYIAQVFQHKTARGQPDGDRTRGTRRPAPQARAQGRPDTAREPGRRQDKALERRRPRRGARTGPETPLPQTHEAMDTEGGCVVLRADCPGVRLPGACTEPVAGAAARNAFWEGHRRLGPYPRFSPTVRPCLDVRSL
ncbi:B-cell scaffold protein with ankyrin repeats [Talpa occidentalis]|uniref:B-cell scaffold protein with ankyrin repeats n=1 Tax=Talpa occidentalis TaxID=50954 RepID=UPI0023F8D34C|nr:B-cell scaffold protein with ankyrin repeats [Talpa occidentalis]